MSSRRGFTLIELLVTVAVIGILASMMMLGMVKAQNAARVARTKAIITKLDALVMRRWDSYATRRVPVNTYGYKPRDAAELRLVALRQLMRLEMPDTWAEVNTAPTTSDLKQVNLAFEGVVFTPPPGYSAPVLASPALTEAYKRYYSTISLGKTADNKPTTVFEDAECLYMIVTLGVMDEGSGRELFADADVGDVDGDGAPEFIDAWGSPIRFLRWPVGFIDDPVYDANAPYLVAGPGSTDYGIGSPRPLFGHLSNLLPPKTSGGAQFYAAPDNNHDPFDVLRRDIYAFKLHPLIYSAGPDRIPDVYAGDVNKVRDDPYIDFRNPNDAWSTNVDDPELAYNPQFDPNDPLYDPMAVPHTHYDPLAGAPVANKPGALVGIPCDLSFFRFNQLENRNNLLNHYDNISNHQMDSKAQ